MTWSPASGRQELEARLRRVGGQADEDIDLAGAALLLAALDRPRVPLDRYRHHLELLRRDTAARGAALGAGESLGARVEALRHVMVEQHGYRGDSLTYDDLQNANLMRVIDRRKGLPVALAILYIAAARHQGWSITGLNFPGHFLLSLELGGERLVLDPFNDAEVLDTARLRALLKAFAGAAAELEPAHYAPAGNRAILLRLQNNIKLRRLQAELPDKALEVVESMLMFAPGDWLLWREIALLHLQQDNLRATTMALEHVLELGTDQRVLHEAATLLQQVKGRLN